jgi:hypothetical protein
MKKREVVFVVQGFQSKDVSGNLYDSCQIEVYASTEEEAINKAKTFIKKEFYRISGVIEK